ncbi:MAG TPA: VWA domain-containing protein [Pyrinomonadaceae bacterium]|nr:VWA domain-containing protein [Pyrinomonadaceae bacterium]
MLYSRKFLAPLLTLLLCAASAYSQKAAGDYSARAELPPGGEITISNARGSVRLEVWGEAHVAIAATVRGEKPRRAPVGISRTGQLLSVSVSPREVGMLTRVELVVKVPERARASIVSETGAVVVRGLPAELSVESVHGDIRAELPASADADIVAESANKGVVSALPLPAGASDGGKVLRARLGAGGRSVRLVSKRGAIALASYTDPRDSSARADAPATIEEADRRSGAGGAKPVLIGAERTGGGAGTPSAPLTGPEEIDEGDVVRVDTELVTLNVSVIDRGTNRGLKGLAEREFKLFEDGSEQQVAHFESANAPFNLVLLIDLSLSTQDKLALIRESALRFVEAARPMDRIGVVAFTHEPVIVSRLTSDRALLRERINAIEKPKGSTNVYDSVAFVMGELFKDAKDSRRNAIVLMSDGLDSTMENVPGPGSEIPYDELLSRLREFDGVLYSLWLNVETEYSSLSPLDIQPETYDLAHDRMEQLADAGGGVFYEVERLEDLAGAYESVVADLGTVYSLSYRPTNKLRDGKWRAIRVLVARPNAVARGKRGYYAN